MINHNENKIEELKDIFHEVIPHTPLKIEETTNTQWDKGYVFYQDLVLADFFKIEKRIVDKFKEYAEHMVQQERERIENGINNLTPYSIGRNEIGNVVSKDSIINLINTYSDE